MRFSPSIGIKYFRYANFNNNDIYDLRNILSVRNIFGMAIVFSVRLEGHKIIYRFLVERISDQQHHLFKVFI
ncbi:MAG: hypothetical protein ACKPKO_43485 [Candidatus Fonsibacter sp.]